MNVKCAVLAGLSALAAISAFAADAKPADAKAREARIKELQKVFVDNVTGHGCWNWYYGRKYMEGEPKGWTDAKLDEMAHKFIDACLELEKLDPTNFTYPYNAGRAYEVLEDFAKAADAYGRAAKLKTNDMYNFADCLYHKASCEFGLGKKDLCKATLEDLAKRKINSARRSAPNPSAFGGMALYFLGGADLTDRMDLPVYTGAKPFPKPQEAKYTEKFIPLTEVAIKVSGIDGDDARVTLLARKLAKSGIKAEVKGAIGGLFSSASYTVEIAVTPDAPVAEKEGYTLEIGEKGAKITAREKRGALWGVVSFLQCCDRPKKVVRVCSIRDWPVTERRGFLGDFWLDSLEFSIFNKINSVDIQDYLPTWGAFLDPLSRWLELELARGFTKYGIDLYYGIAWATMYPVLPLSEKRTLDLHVARAMEYASVGAGLYYPYDDGRYTGNDPKTGLHVYDAQKFGKGANCDADHINKIYRAVKAKYPDFKMIFCPPFYWGPDSRSSYPEDREEYLKSLRKIDPEVDLYWTGPMVKSFDKKEYQVKWFTDLTGHKPTIFQNGVGAHNLVGYTIDIVPITRWHYKQFYKDIACFHHNAHTPQDSSRTATQMDGLWNPEGFEEVESIRRALNQLCGEKAYDLLAPGLPALTYFDKYKHGRVTADILKEDVKDLEAKIALAQKCWKEAMAYNPRIAWWGQYYAGIEYAQRALGGAKNPPDFFKQYEKQIAATEQVAKDEVGFDKAKGDIFYSPVDFFGASQTMEYSDVRKKNVPRRFCRCIRGDGSNMNEFSFAFTCDPFPPAGDYELVIRGLDDEAKASNSIEVSINGTVIASGELGFVDDEYKTVKVRVPFKTMKRNNGVKIRNITPGTNPNGTPWFMVNYIVVRKVAK